eukprot:6482682-Amphidinium_carterae.5
MKHGKGRTTGTTRMTTCDDIMLACVLMCYQEINSGPPMYLCVCLSIVVPSHQTTKYKITTLRHASPCNWGGKRDSLHQDLIGDEYGKAVQSLWTALMESLHPLAGRGSRVLAGQGQGVPSCVCHGSHTILPRVDAARMRR